MVHPQYLLEIVQQCVEKGIFKIWFHRGVGQGSIDKEALKFCTENGLDIVPGACPLMFLEDSMFLHRFHGWWWRRKNKIKIPTT